MASTDFSVLLKAVLDKSGINTELKQVQEIVKKYSIDIMPELKTASLRNQMKSVSKDIANDFNKAFGTNLTGNDVFKAFENQAKAVETARKAQEKHNETIRKGKELAKQQADDRFVKKQSDTYGSIIKTQEKIYSLKQKLLSADKMETEEITKQIKTLETKNKYSNYKLSKNGMIDTSWEKEVSASREVLENQYRINAAKKQDKAVETTRKQTADAQRKTSKESRQAYNDLLKIARQLNGLRTKQLKITPESNPEQWKTLSAQIDEVSSKYDKLWSEFWSKPQNLEFFKMEDLNRLKELGYTVDEIKSKLKDMLSGQVDNIKFGIDTEEYSTEMAKINNQLSKYGSLSGEVFSKAQASADSLSTAYQEMQTIFADTTGKYTNEDKIQAEQRYQEKLITTKNLLAQLNSDKDNEIVHMGDEKRVNMINTLNNYLSKNTAMSSKNRKEIEKWIATLASSDDMTVGSIKNINTQFQTLDAQLRKTGQLGLSFKDKIGQAWEKFGGWSLATGALMRLGQEAKKGVGFIKELDDALTDVAYTSDVSKSALKDLGNSSVEMAKDLNTSATNVLDAVKIYSTANASADDIMRKSKPAIMLSNISGMGGAESAKTIQTSLNQFELEDTETGLMDITDTLMYVSGQLNYDFTEGMKEITEGVEASGSVAKSAGLDFQEYATMVGLAVEQTGQSGSTIGNAYKTIFSRITSASKGQGALADDLSNAEAALRGIGVQVRDSEKDFRDLTDIMNDIGKVWDTLEDSEKAEVGYQVAGTRQLNILNSLFGSWDRYEDVMGNIDDRTGTTLKNQEEYANSLQGHLGEISATVQSIWNNVFDTDQFKGILKLFDGLLGKIEDLTGFLGSTGSLGLGLGAFLSVKDIGTA